MAGPEQNPKWVTLFNPLFLLFSLLKVDFSRNGIRRLNKDVLEGLEDDLLDLRLDHNLLGNNYNPIFASQEIAKLTALQVRWRSVIGRVDCDAFPVLDAD